MGSEIIGIGLFYMVVVNVAAFLLYGIDKKRAEKQKWRIPEATLLTVAAIGGGCGAFLGMKYFRHKTKHWKFKILVPIFMVIQIVILIAIIVYFVR